MIPPLAFKIAVQLIEDQLLPQSTEPADLAPETLQTQKQPLGNKSVLALLGKQVATTTEPAPKVVTDSGKLS